MSGTVPPKNAGSLTTKASGPGGPPHSKATGPARPRPPAKGKSKSLAKGLAMSKLVLTKKQTGTIRIY